MMIEPERSKEELQAMIDKMRAVSDAFYPAAQRTGHHAFIEFTGLMNEYITLCEAALRQGIDFTATTIHGGGQTLPMESYHQAYLNEKLQCIYGVSLDALMGRAPLPQVKKKAPRKAARAHGERKTKTG